MSSSIYPRQLHGLLALFMTHTQKLAFSHLMTNPILNGQISLLFQTYLFLRKKALKLANFDAISMVFFTELLCGWRRVYSSPLHVYRRNDYFECDYIVLNLSGNFAFLLTG